ncbi:MAG: kelch repeat-containing protein [candidate division WOR-3 bacterium]
MKKVFIFLAVITILGFTVEERWTRLSPGGTAPAGRCGSASVYDSLTDRFIVWGGAYSGGVFNDLFALDSTAYGSGTWRQLNPSGTVPGGRYYPAYVYDYPRRRMVIFGGFNRSQYFNDVHFLDSINNPSPRWTQPAVGGTPPSPRYACGSAYDPIKERMIVFGGGTTGGGDNLVFVLENLNSIPVWRQLNPAGSPPPGKHGPTCIYDFRNDRLLVFAGYPHSNDVWALDSLQYGDGRWSQWSPGGSLPPARNGAISFLDRWNDRMVIFGGWNGSQFFNDLYSLDGISSSPSWTQLSPSGTTPSPRWAPSGALDGLRRRYFVFGGIGSGYFNDVFTLTWGLPVAEEMATSLNKRIIINPNPFHRQLSIRSSGFDLSRCLILIYDAQGRLVRRLSYNNKALITWDGRDAKGSNLPSGTYFISLNTGKDKIIERVVKIR